MTVCLAIGVAGTAQDGWAQGSAAESFDGTGVDTIRLRNKNTVGIIAGDYAGTHLHVVTDLAAVLNDGANLRVLPVVGLGSVQNVEDLLYLSGIDVAIVQSDVLDHLKRGGASADLGDRVNYIAKLFNEEFHLVAGAETAFVADLAGRKVSFGPEGGGASITARAVFAGLGIEVEPVFLDPALALEKIRTGEIAAMAYVGGKPVDGISALKREDGFHLLPVDYAEPLRAAYLPAKFTVEDYPGLVDRGERISSISVGSVMAVYNWTSASADRFERVSRFMTAFLANQDALKQAPRHPKWREFNAGVTIPGWQRWEPAARLIGEKSGNDGKQGSATAVPVMAPARAALAPEPAGVARTPSAMAIEKLAAPAAAPGKAGASGNQTAGKVETRAEAGPKPKPGSATEGARFGVLESLVQGFAKGGKAADRIE
ncbi:MAG: TAXI family TRAP transporter solute-binding subunit [Hyphomicrobiales bacterium]